MGHRKLAKLMSTYKPGLAPPLNTPLLSGYASNPNRHVVAQHSMVVLRQKLISEEKGLCNELTHRLLSFNQMSDASDLASSEERAANVLVCELGVRSHHDGSGGGRQGALHSYTTPLELGLV